MVSTLKVYARNGLALLGVWASTYLDFLEDVSAELSDAADDLVVPVLVLSIIGMGGAFWTARKLSRDPEWRARHGLLGRPGMLASRRR
jgi:hypothetical protein